MEPERVVVGRIAKAFGLRGQVVVIPTGDDPDRFSPGTTVFLAEAGDASVVINGCKRLENVYHVSFDGRPDRTAVEDLVGCVLYQDTTALPKLPDGTYYHFQLIGIAVTQPDGTRLGVLQSVLSQQDSDLYQVCEGDAEWLIPGRKEFVAWIDLEKRELRLTNRSDLLDAQSPTTAQE